MVFDLKASFELGFRLFLRDFNARYRQSLFGIFWVILLPLFAVAVFVIMNKSGILRVKDTGIPYTIFALYGMTVWSLLTGLISSISGVVGQTGGLVTKINFPRIALIQSPILISLVDFLIRVALLFTVMAVFNVWPNKLGIILPLLLIPIILLSIGIGMFLSIIGAVFKDIPNFINMFFSIAMFITPVVYPMPDEGLLSKINYYNPLFYLIDTPRAVFFHGVLEGYIQFISCAFIGLVVFLAGWRFYQVAMSRIVEKV
jgi:lipopolysaccharide transport system permease protein